MLISVCGTGCLALTGHDHGQLVRGQLKDLPQRRHTRTRRAPLLPAQRSQHVVSGCCPAAHRRRDIICHFRQRCIAVPGEG